MSLPYSCRCLEPTPNATGCAQCGGERQPVVVWREDVSESDRPPPRTDPPRHAEAAALELYKRVAAHSPPRVRKRFHTREIITGLAVLSFAGVVYYFDWDQSLLRLISIALGLVGMITLLKGLLGHGRGS